MSIRFYQSAFVHDKYSIGVLDSGQTMGDNNNRSFLYQCIDSFMDLFLRFGIQSGSGFIQYEDRRVFQQGPGDSQPLALPTGELSPLFTDDSI